MSRPLEGLLVVSVEQAVAAPMCTCRLADAGARVIKIERPEGDFARGYDDLVHGECSYFVWLNRGKESVVLDLTAAADKALLAAMLERADVFVQNLKPGSVGKLGFPIARLRREHPRLICCSISGYGESGPLAMRKSYDMLIQAESGLASITGTIEPSRVGVSVVDIASGMNAYEAILEALIERARTGEGAELSISMFDAMADWMTVPLLQQEAGAPPRRIGLAHVSISPYGAFRSRDGIDILISIQSDREWRTLAEKVLDGRRARRRSRLRHQRRTRQAPCRDGRQSRRGIWCVRRRITDEKTRRRRHRLRARQQSGRAGAASASAPHYRRNAERPGVLSGAGRTARRGVAALRSGAGARRAHRQGAFGIYPPSLWARGIKGNARSKIMDIGFIGLGNMGAHMARRLVEAGHKVIVYDTRQEAIGNLAALGAVAARSPKEVADAAETVMVSLPTPDIVLKVATGPDGVIEGKRVRRFVDLSTTGSVMAQRIFAALKERNIVQIDAPVSGGVQRCGKRHRRRHGVRAPRRRGGGRAGTKSDRQVLFHR